jgi:hypothetical protein
VLDRRRAPEFEEWLEKMRITDYRGELLAQSSQYPLLGLAESLQEALEKDAADAGGHGKGHPMVKIPHLPPPSTKKGSRLR